MDERLVPIDAEFLARARRHLLKYGGEFDPARRRPNLSIQANALTECLLFEGKRCSGVVYTFGGRQYEARANREVIVSTGSINSPQLLELSGIGRPEVLEAAGIEVRHELRGLGENLRDHYSPRMKWAVPHTLGMTYNAKARGLGMAWQALRYATTHKGLLGLPAAPIRAYVRPRPGLEAPDASISWIPFLVGDNFQLAKDSGVTAIMNIFPDDPGCGGLTGAASEYWAEETDAVVTTARQRHEHLCRGRPADAAHRRRDPRRRSQQTLAAGTIERGA